MLAVALALPARAETRTTSFAAFLHVGPGRQYAVTDEVPTRTELDVAGCKDDWCHVRYGDAFGWIEQRMFAAQAQPALPSGGECADFARTGWPRTGDHERLCLQKR